jgi:hypothetical protein
MIKTFLRLSKYKPNIIPIGSGVAMILKWEEGKPKILKKHNQQLTITVHFCIKLIQPMGAA